MRLAMREAAMGDLLPRETPAAYIETPGYTVREAVALVEVARRLLDAAVATERARGTRWEQIGTELGVTRATAHGRFADAFRSLGADGARKALDEEWATVAGLAQQREERLALLQRLNEDSHA